MTDTLPDPHAGHHDRGDARLPGHPGDAAGRRPARGGIQQPGRPEPVHPDHAARRRHLHRPGLGLQRRLQLPALPAAGQHPRRRHRAVVPDGASPTWAPCPISRRPPARSPSRAGPTRCSWSTPSGCPPPSAPEPAAQIMSQLQQVAADTDRGAASYRGAVVPVDAYAGRPGGLRRLERGPVLGRRRPTRSWPPSRRSSTRSGPTTRPCRTWSSSGPTTRSPSPASPTAPPSPTSATTAPPPSQARTTSKPTPSPSATTSATTRTRRAPRSGSAAPPCTSRRSPSAVWSSRRRRSRAPSPASSTPTATSNATASLTTGYSFLTSGAQAVSANLAARRPQARRR